MGTLEGTASLREGSKRQRAWRAVSQTGQKASHAMRRGYDRSVQYAREHPGRTGLIMLGSGIAIGMLLARGMRNSRHTRHTDYRRVARPLVDALADVGRMLTR